MPTNVTALGKALGPREQNICRKGKLSALDKRSKKLDLALLSDWVFSASLKNKFREMPKTCRRTSLYCLVNVDF